VKNVRVFTLGVDQAVNAAFLRRLAAAGGGACELVESEDRLDDVMAKVHRRIATPVVTELAVAGDGVTIDDTTRAPHRIPALFTGAPVLIAARAAGRVTAGTIVVTGKTPSGQPWSQRISIRAETKGDAAAAMWARARIRDLEDLYATRSWGKDELEREIVATSLRHRVLSRFTAFLAIDRAEKVNVGGNPRAVVQPVEAPAGWAGLANAPMAMPAQAQGRMRTMMVGAPAPMAPPPPPMGAPAPITMQAPPGAGGLLARAKKMISRKRDASMEMDDDGATGAAPAPAADRTPYLKRAKDLADAVDRAATRTALDLAVARLAELVEDVRSLGWLDDLAQELDAVLTTLRAILGDPSAPLDAARKAADGLRHLGGGAPRPPGRAFWK
jgi:Ca-activated chloride channel family protein